MCDHKNVVLLADGWYCPDCGEQFAEKPKAPKKAETKPKEPKKAEPKKAKSTAKK